MLKKNEFQILEKLFTDLEEELSINQIAVSLNQKYPQAYKTVLSLQKRGLITLKKIGKSKIVKLNMTSFNNEFVQVELQRTIHFKNKKIKEIQEILSRIDLHFTCILFGSYARNENKNNSDIDLLFIIDLADTDRFKEKIKTELILYNVDIEVITKESLFEMWSSNKLSVGKELLKNHIILIGHDYFVRILRKWIIKD
jgi:predicted nucleotidyltransferase